LNNLQSSIFFISFLQAFIERGISIVQIPNAKR